MKKCIWAFILGVAGMDVSFTWLCRTTVREWESNPVAAMAYDELGAIGAIGYRALWLAFAAAMASTRNRISGLITPVWGVGHLYLLAALLQSLPFLKALGG